MEIEMGVDLFLVLELQAGVMERERDIQTKSERAGCGGANRYTCTSVSKAEIQTKPLFYLDMKPEGYI